MSLFQAPLLKRESIQFADAELELFELSAFDRCEYLEVTTGHIEMPKEGELPLVPEIENLGQMWAFRREDISSKLLLVAYALKPGREESLADLHGELRRSVSLDRVDDLYVPAAKLSGLYVDPKKVDTAVDGDESAVDGEESSEKKG